MASPRTTLTLLMIVATGYHVSVATYDIGVCYGMQGNDLPSATDVISMYTKYAGNEAIPGEFSQYIAPAMQNLRAVLDANKMVGIEVTTVVSTATLGTSYPPSNGVFSTEVANEMTNILKVISSIGSSLMVNVYPYFAYAADPANVRLDYAQFTATESVVQDGNLGYSNMFDAIVDAFYWAMEKAGVTNVDIAVSESGWPSAGNGNFTTPTLAATYNKNFMNHVMKNGTPKRPQTYMDAYVFAMFNENLKTAGVEQNFGLFFPNMQPVYPMGGQVEKSRNADLHCVDWNPHDENLILTGSANNSVRMFDHRNLTSGGVGSPIYKFEDHKAAVLCMQVGKKNDCVGARMPNSSPALFLQHAGHRCKAAYHLALPI
ncbi:hypothetical protein HHK36_025415 [Tetracentron sinense]|uniref:Glucan endo-1,3-beta-D-glucosidase n=1 Tax=Tetracentron sinense TaxID=13715 RepID=A0A834YIP5_TETSI|nr:hypothetical protein HHK36_025415 [Tetracentron sinense]